MPDTKPKRIAIVGPLPPLRSGIARHTCALAAELAGRKGLEVRAWSFSRQYPARLFPGEAQVDPALAPPAGVAVATSIDTLLPLSWGRTAKEIAEFAPDIAIVPAWTFFVAPALGWISRSLRKRGIEVVAMVHNARDHEAARWKNRLLGWQVMQAGRAVAHNAPVAAEIARIAPLLPSAICPHPLYDDYPAPTGSLPRRAGLELLFYGLVRPYKGLDVLLDALAKRELRDVKLTVAGEFWSGLDGVRRQVAQLGIEPLVEIIPRYQSDAETAELFTRCDALVAPYRAASGSGVLALAQHYERPVIASDVPGLREAVCDGETGWLFPAGDVDALAALLATKVTRENARSMQPALAGQRASLSWARLADALLG
ncbi:glycosyltransferase [Tsuneonella mangrovi]|uniref:glycosyltransferase n=1 Tax=Tsuneonella mangrovi TaxID=1982042 RepID=UPI00147163DA|nr:glycosyltransferase [Tsuneonella mangrovi]